MASLAPFGHPYPLGWLVEHMYVMLRGCGTTLLESGRRRLPARRSGLHHLTITQPDQVDELRRGWPELVERIERIVELVDWERPA